MSVLRTLIGVGGACLFAWLLFRYSIFSLGFPLIAFFCAAARLRLEHRPRGVGDDPALGAGRGRARVGGDLPRGAGVGRLLPDRACCRLAAVRRVGAAVGARVRGHARACCCRATFPWNHFWAAALLDIVYLGIGVGTFQLAIDYARVHGKLLQMGE